MNEQLRQLFDDGREISAISDPKNAPMRYARWCVAVLDELDPSVREQFQSYPGLMHQRLHLQLDLIKSILERE